MKVTLAKNIIVVVVLTSCSVVFGQANFLLRNILPSQEIDAPVFDADGVPLVGPSYLAELWGGAEAESLAPAVVLDGSNRREFTPFTFISPGYFSSREGFLVVPAVPPRGFAWLQVRAWDASLGATYEDAAATAMGGYGESPLFFAQGGDPFDQFPLPAPLIGLESFRLRSVPEPSTSILLACGAVACWWFLRRRRSGSRNPGS